MGVSKIMNTFFAGMQDQVMSSKSGRLVNTPMGPFKWNDNIELWENVNNGMVMNNISLNDLMMIGYESVGGDLVSDKDKSFFTGSMGVLTASGGAALTLANTDYWAAIGAASTTLANGSEITFKRPCTITIVRNDDDVSIPSQTFYSINNGAKTQNTGSPISVSVGFKLKVGIRTMAVSDGTGQGTISIFIPAISNSIPITTVPYFYIV